MSIISITLTESPVQIVSGIPRTITFNTNVPATVFYTLDGTDPSLLTSFIAIGAILMPTNSGTIELKAFATDGISTSSIFSYTFGPDTIGNRNPRDKIIYLDNGPSDGRAFGDNGGSLTSVAYANVGGVTVDDFELDQIPDGYDGAVGIADYTNKTYDFSNYEIKYSETNDRGDTGVGIGNLPSKVTFIVPDQKNKSFNANSKLFNPKAMVIYQDGTVDPADEDHPLINREFFCLPTKKPIRDGSMYYTTGFEGNTTTGSLVRPIYSPADNTYIFYYRDAESNRWIISKEAMPEMKPSTMMANFVLPQTSMASKRVMQWVPFKWRRLP